MTLFEKQEACPDCGGELSQAEYDGQFCRACGTVMDFVHPDDLAVDAFAAAMKAKLRRKRKEGRGGWEDPERCSAAYLSELLHCHVAKGDPVDVGNLAMMLHQRGEQIARGDSKADRAVSHLLSAIIDDGRKAWLLGFGTASFALLTEAYAEHRGLDLGECRRSLWESCRPVRVVEVQEEEELVG